MGFFSWLDKHARESNDIAFRASVEREMEIERREEEKKTWCCANCFWFEESECGKNYWCIKHNFCFDIIEAVEHKIHYRKICDYYEKK